MMSPRDIQGKYYDAPLYHLLVCKTRNGIPVYNTCIDFSSVENYKAWHVDAVALAQSLLDEGIAFMKIWLFDRFSESSFGQYIGLEQVEEELIPVRQVCEEVGNSMEIGIKCHFRWNRACMERIMRTRRLRHSLSGGCSAVYPDEIKILDQRTTIPIVGSSY